MTMDAAPRHWLPVALGWFGLVLHLPVGFLYLTAGLVTPLWAIMILWVVWLLLLAAAVWLLIRHPVWTLAIPVAALLILLGTVSLGGWLLGWSA